MPGVRDTLPVTTRAYDSSSADHCQPSGSLVCLDLVGEFQNNPFHINFRERADSLACPKALSRNIRLGSYHGVNRPEPGIYGLGLRTADFEAPFYFANDIRSADTSRSYMSIRGQLVIRTSTAERVEGTFSYTGAEYRTHWPGGERTLGTSGMRRISDAAPRREFRGNFSVKPGPLVLRGVQTGNRVQRADCP